jgi:hypothetical protein
MNRKKRTFSKPFDDALIKMEMIGEMAIEDGWASLDECLEQAPKALAILTRHAEAALRVMKRIEERECTMRPSEM